MREEQNNFATFGWKDEACSTFWSDFSTWIYALCLAIIIQIAGVALGKSVKLFWLVLCVCEGTLKKNNKLQCTTISLRGSLARSSLAEAD